MLEDLPAEFAMSACDVVEWLDMAAAVRLGGEGTLGQVDDAVGCCVQSVAVCFTVRHAAWALRLTGYCESVGESSQRGRGHELLDDDHLV